jgi:hypothetical protein
MERVDAADRRPGDFAKGEFENCSRYFRAIRASKTCFQEALLETVAVEDRLGQQLQIKKRTR